MKYTVNYFDLNTKEDIIKYYNDCNNAFNKEKDEIVAKDENVAPSLFGEYMKSLTYYLQNMTRNPSKEMQKALYPILGKALGRGRDQKIYSNDAIITALENGKLEVLLNTFERVYGQNFPWRLKEAAQFTKSDLQKEAEGVAKDAGEVFLKKAKAQKEKDEEKKAKKAEITKKADEKLAATKGKKALLEKQRTENMAKTLKLGNRNAGRKYRLYNKETITVKGKEKVLNAYAKTIDENKEIPDVKLNNLSYDGIANDMQFIKVRLDNVKNEPWVFKACALDVYHQLVMAHNTRSFWNKVFHPFKNSHENDLITEMKTDLLRENVSEEEINAAKLNDFKNEYLKDLIEEPLPEPVKIEINLEENQIDDFGKENNEIVNENVKEI